MPPQARISSAAGAQSSATLHNTLAQSATKCGTDTIISTSKGIMPAFRTASFAGWDTLVKAFITSSALQRVDVSVCCSCIVK